MKIRYVSRMEHRLCGEQQHAVKRAHHHHACNHAAHGHPAVPYDASLRPPCIPPAPHPTWRWQNRLLLKRLNQLLRWQNRLLLRWLICAGSVAESTGVAVAVETGLDVAEVADAVAAAGQLSRRNTNAQFM